MAFECEQHGMVNEPLPCPLCMKVLEIEEIEARAPTVPDNIVKHVHVHDPGPCPECRRKTDAAFRQRKALLLALFLAMVGLVVGNLLKLQDPAKSLSLIPSIVVAVLGVLVPPALGHSKLED